MDDLTDQQRLVWMGALGQHLAAVLTPLLPDDRELVATGSELAVMLRRPGAPLRMAATFQLPTPHRASQLGAGVVDEILRELQDEIVLHLGETWPTTVDGRMLRAVARDADDGVAISFEPPSGDQSEALELAPFVPPIGATRIAG